MKILLINNGTKYLGKLKDLLLNHEVKIVKMLGKYESVGFDLVILSGGHQYSIIGEPEVFRKESELVLESRKPILGICLGCEIIAYAFEAEFKYLSHNEKGVKNIEFLTREPFTEKPSDFTVFENHHWAINKLSKSLVGIARSKKGFEIIKHKTLPIFGFQFHPEITVDKNKGYKIFQDLIRYLESNYLV